MLFVISNATVWLSSLGPAVMAVAQPATVCAPASSVTVWSAPLVNDGASLTAVTVTVKVRTAVPLSPAVPRSLSRPPSVTVTVITAEPDALATGV